MSETNPLSGAEAELEETTRSGTFEVLIMRIPTIISGIAVFFFLLMNMRFYTNVEKRQIFLAFIGFAIVSLNTVMIFFASIHCPETMYVAGELKENNCTEWWALPRRN